MFPRVLWAILLLPLVATGTETHWAFQPVRRPHVPAGTNAIDHFVGRSLQRAGLTPSPPADRRTLARRASFDLTGLPPTPAMVADFSTDRITWEQLVERLLASPRHGERWAQHWLDVVRYADTHGFEVNTPRPNAWPYRDYVIRAFNEDRPYDRFIREQLVGDALDADPATGFLVAAAVLLPGQIGKDDASKRLARQDSLDEMIVTTGETFLGLTIGCARCHEHKFDPVTLEDYYALQAFFAGVHYGDRPLENEASKTRRAQAGELEKKIAAIDRQLKKFEPIVHLGRTIIIDDEDKTRNTHLHEKQGHGTNPKGTKRGYLDDPGDADRSPNFSDGRYTWWKHRPGQNVFTYNPGVAGRFDVWLSWGAHGSGVHTRDARYILDRDGDLDTRADQTEIARIDQYHFAGITNGTMEKKPLWSGFTHAGTHEFSATSRILLRGGETGTGITADTIVLQEPYERQTQPRLRAPVNPARNVERFAPVTTRRVRFTVLATVKDNFREPCIDELEIFTAGQSPMNIALATHGTKATASESTDSDRHRIAHINDGLIGNSHSWMSRTKGGGWIELEFKQRETIDRIVWARDREGRFKDRLPVRYRIEILTASGGWISVAGSEDRLPFGTPIDPATVDLRSLSPDDAERANELAKQRRKLEQEKQQLTKPQLVYAGRFETPDETHVLRRGDPEQPLAAIAPRVPVALTGPSLPADSPEQLRRKTLADWIASPHNPLTARVMVNRVWQFHFGTGLVGTSSDFGRNGARPSHPELLDWLADEFVSADWSVKHLHRLILASRTYRQSGRVHATGQKIDADNRLLWRFPSRRLEAEAIRDSILFVSGRLNLKTGGPGFSFFKTRGGLSGFPPVTEFADEHRRRMIYQHKIRMEPVPVFGAFDCPDAGQPMPQRKDSTTAIQALNLFNSPFVNDEAIAFAKRVAADVGDDTNRQIAHVFQLPLARKPTITESLAAGDTVRDHGLATLCRVLFNSNEFLFLP